MESQFHTAGSPVWIWTSESDGWRKGTVEKVGSDGKLQVRLDNGSVGSYKPDDCPLRNVESRMGVEVCHNLRALPELKHAGLTAPLCFRKGNSAGPAF